MFVIPSIVKGLTTRRVEDFSLTFEMTQGIEVTMKNPLTLLASQIQVAYYSTTTEGSMRDHNYYVYILSNWNNKVIYVGITNNLERRVVEHKQKKIPGFTQRYNVTKLVYFEHTTDVYAAISREKQIKKWRRAKKNALIEQMNPQWKDLSLEWE